MMWLPTLATRSSDKYVPPVSYPFERQHAEVFVTAAVAAGWARNPQFA